MKEIEKYLFLNEAAIKFGIPYETLKNKVKPSLANQDQIEEMIERGIIRFFEAPRDPEKKYTRSKKSWLVTEQAIKEWFPE